MKNILLILSTIILAACAQPSPKKLQTKAISSEINTQQKIVEPTYGPLDEAIFGMGCFWCTEAVFEELRGVASVESGYTGGKTKNPTYDDISNKETGHAEVALIKYDPTIISFETLLDVFWTTHNPTTLNRQGADVGTQYRSSVFYKNESQKNAAEKSKQEVAPTVWADPIITEIVALTKFYSAEGYHQNYYQDNPNYGYCVAVINPKLDKLHKKFAHLLKGAELQSKEILNKGNYNQLSDFDENVIDKKGTERAYSGAYWNNKKKGIYICKRCNQPLFKSGAKFDSKTGWPSFDDIYGEGAVKEVRDHDGYRTEIVCGHCNGHLGHVFKGEGFTSKKTRHCVNSASLNFSETK